MNSRKDLRTKLAELHQHSSGQHSHELPVASQNGPRKYWQCLEELTNTQEFNQLLRQEFPALADIWPESLSRRRFLSLMGASLALAGIGGCSVRPAPEGTIVPYVHPPEEVIPGVPLFYASTTVHGGDAVGVLVESHEGRPTKIEGNPDHPASLGATDAINQASVLSLYDPLRSQAVVHRDNIMGWDDVQSVIQAAMSDQRPKRGRGLRILTESVNSPTLGWQIDQILAAYPEAKWCQYEPVGQANRRLAAQTAFGQPVDTIFDFKAANVVLTLDSDFLFSEPGHNRYANDFMSRRRVRTTKENAKSAQMNRLYVVETDVTSTGVKADHRLALRMSEIEALAFSMAAAIGVSGINSTSTEHAKWVNAVARDLKANAGKCVVVAGQRQPPAVHLLVHAMNEQLGNIGHTAHHIKAVDYHPVDEISALRELAQDMDSGAVEALFILGGDPAYKAPVDFDFARKLQKVKLSFHLSLYENETSRLCTWHLPAAHYLEVWSDARAYDGTASIVQPLIAPLYEGRSAHEVLAVMAGERDVDGRKIVQSYWRTQYEHRGGGPGQFDAFWDTVLHDGVIGSSAYAPMSVQLRNGWQSQLTAAANASKTQVGSQNSLEIVFQADPTIYDGRYANNGWLQELPKPVTKLTWDNAVLMSPRTAQELGVEYSSFSHDGEHGGYDVPLLTLQLGEQQVQAPAWIVPGHADRSVTVHLGYGQKHAARSNGEWQETLGFNAYLLRASDHLWYAPKLDVIKLDATYPLACTQAHHLMAERDVIRPGTLEEYHDHPEKIARKDEPPRGSIGKEGKPPRGTLYSPYDYSPPKHKWGMSIDTTTCIGCNACVIACQSENNIPVVGKEQVRFGREMHWIRIDRYIKGELESPENIFFQPVPCMHCEHAPCEYVCPVEATVHSAEGLNDMVYNRCVGTRFCSNNCPYKVRRFNFLAYADFKTVPLRLQYNPDVTVRSRGVMEKCSYCVQRIRNAEINAEGAGRPIRDGDVLTACQAACPAQAIVFGDINDNSSAVAKWKNSPLDYGLLEELNTYPRTTYIAALRNPNPELEAG